jgi:hypothetical protein
MQPTLSIIIVNYNSGGQVKNLINSFGDMESSEIIIVDNASVDDSHEVLSEMDRDDISFIWNEENLGFGRANNLGVTKARGDFLMLINPDSRLLDGVDVECYIKSYLSDEEVGLVAPKIIYPNGTIQPSWAQRYSTLPTFIAQLLSLGWVFRQFRGTRFIKSVMSIFGRLLFRDAVEEYIRRFAGVSHVVSCCWVSGACFGIRKELFNKLGGFDDQFFLYSEDEDLCRRIRMHGKKILYAPEMQICHAVGGTHAKRAGLGVLGRADACRMESALIYLRKYTETGWGWVKWSFVTVATFRLVFGLFIVVSPRRSFKLLTRLASA